MEALQKLHDLLHVQQAIDPAVTTYTWVFDATPGFFDGTRGRFISWPFVAGVAAIPEAAPGIAGHSGFAPNPAVVTSGSVDGSEFFGVPVYAENKDEAWCLLDLISSREGQRVVALGGWGSIYSGVLNEPDIVEAFPFYPALAKAYEYPVDGGWSEDRSRWTQMLSDEIHEVLAPPPAARRPALPEPRPTPRPWAAARSRQSWRDRTRWMRPTARPQPVKGGARPSGRAPTPHRPVRPAGGKREAWGVGGRFYLFVKWFWGVVLGWGCRGFGF